jgi:hypothetical protein
MKKANLNNPLPILLKRVVQFVYDAASNNSVDNYLLCRYVCGLSDNWDSPVIWSICYILQKPTNVLPPIERGYEFTFVRFC